VVAPAPPDWPAVVDSQGPPASRVHHGRGSRTPRGGRRSERGRHRTPAGLHRTGARSGPPAVAPGAQPV